MNLYLISQSINNGYDTYGSAVVAAETEEMARHMHPCGEPLTNDNDWNWAPSESVAVRLIGIAIDCEVGVVCANFRAG
jgi:hypothetical protein